MVKITCEFESMEEFQLYVRMGIPNQTSPPQMKMPRLSRIEKHHKKRGRKKGWWAAQSEEKREELRQKLAEARQRKKEEREKNQSGLEGIPDVRIL